ATQAWANPRYGPDGLARLRDGTPVEGVFTRRMSTDDGRAVRQIGMVDATGRAATYTGNECHEWAGGRAGEGYAAQGNILVAGEMVDALAETFESTARKQLSERLLDCLNAAQAAGGNRRGQQSSSLLIV